ncbi:hypothetical protein HNR08_003563 [Cellulomonas hominis]|uniref:Uncharacterized protein n=1 Tax=Cellulomonas hominis TaxID=156981 RepID=A0A7W8WBT1_9CELL|nr:hypothetical protein [Cellulomonas hominis]
MQRGGAAVALKEWVKSPGVVCDGFRVIFGFRR